MLSAQDLKALGDVGKPSGVVRKASTPPPAAPPAPAPRPAADIDHSKLPSMFAPAATPEKEMSLLDEARRQNLSAAQIKQLELAQAQDRATNLRAEARSLANVPGTSVRELFLAEQAAHTAEIEAHRMAGGLK